jgi:dihydroxyacetone kinase-like protein
MTEAEMIRALVQGAQATIAAHAAELTALDQAIGDGDHGLNMARGFDAVAAAADELAGLEPGAALQKAGMILVMKVGGASGPLYGSLLMGMGKAAPAPLSVLLAAGVEAVKARGKSDVGAKTMLDVLGPVADALAAGAGADEVRRTAAAALEATREMRATKGRAAFLGERSVGHLDPGARSAALLVSMTCDVLEGA